MKDVNRDVPVQPARFQPTRQLNEQKRPNFTRAQITTFAIVASVASFLWFIFTAKSVRLEITPSTAVVEVTGGFELQISQIRLLRKGDYQLSVIAPGYHTLEVPLAVGEPRNQIFSYQMTPLPGRIAISTDPPGAEIFIDNISIGVSPLTEDIASGLHTVAMTKNRYQPAELEFRVEGRRVNQVMHAKLKPNWANVTIPSTPSSATVFIDDISVGNTPGPVQILSGEHRIKVKSPGYKSWNDIIYVKAQEKITLAPIELVQADGLIFVRSTPLGASITINGEYQGITPSEIEVAPHRKNLIRIFKIGYEPAVRNIQVNPGEESSITLNLESLTGTLIIETTPKDVELWIDGERSGNAHQTVILSAIPHEIELRKIGYAGYRKTITPQPGFTQEIKVKLLTLEEARFAQLKPTIKTTLEQELVLLKPSPLRLGASRREPGRRANEVLRNVNLSRLFYLGRKEVTNADFREFASGHSSGQFVDTKLDKDDQPVTNITWEEAALYCNWLSNQEGLATFYSVEFGKVTGAKPEAIGYRLPTEAEWAWTSRQTKDTPKLLRFPWGDKLPPPDRHGNYADRSATHIVGRIIFGYNDNHIVAAPVGTFKPNGKGIYDLGGNVSEWIHDFYEIPESNERLNPLGPPEGNYHVIKGSSWMHGTISELRLAFRDYGSQGRQDVGFRLARFAE